MPSWEVKRHYESSFNFLQSFCSRNERHFHQKATFASLPLSRSAFLSLIKLESSPKAGTQDSASPFHSFIASLRRSFEFSLLQERLGCCLSPTAYLLPLPPQDLLLWGPTLHCSPGAPCLSTLVSPSLSTLFSHTHFIGVLLCKLSEAYFKSMDYVSPQPESKAFGDKKKLYFSSNAAVNYIVTGFRK